MGAVARRSIWGFCAYLLIATVFYAWLAEVLAERFSGWYFASAWRGRDNLFLTMILPTGIWLLATSDVTPGFGALARRASVLLCSIYVVACLLFGGYGFAALMAMDAVLQVINVFREPK